MKTIRTALEAWRHQVAQDESLYFVGEEAIASNALLDSIAERARQLMSVSAVQGIPGVQDRRAAGIFHTIASVIDPWRLGQM